MLSMSVLDAANAALDFKNTNCWIFGLKEIAEKQNYEFQTEIIPFILESNLSAKNIASSNTLFVSTKEAEAIKLFKNTFLAVKVGFCNEFFRFCCVLGATLDPSWNHIGAQIDQKSDSIMDGI